MSLLKKYYLLSKRCSNQACELFIKNTKRKTCPLCKSDLENFYDYLKLFSLPENFKLTDLQASYKKLSLFFHPDVKKDSGEDFIFLKEGYEALKKGKEAYLENLKQYQEMITHNQVINEKEETSVENFAPPENNPKDKSNSSSPQATSRSGWVRNNLLQSINIFSGFLLGITLGFTTYFFTMEKILFFGIFCFFLALGGVWNKTLLLLLVALELICLGLFSFLVFKQYFLLAFLTLPLIYGIFLLFKKLKEKTFNKNQ